MQMPRPEKDPLVIDLSRSPGVGLKKTLRSTKQ